MRKTSAIAAIGLTLCLGACVTVFPKAEPVQLYSFKAATAAVASASKPSVTVLRGPTTFTRVAATDRILTKNGAETAYLEGARWAAPASVLFDEALAAAFDSSTVRLATRGEPGPPDAVLRVEVRTFEARYLNGPAMPPTAVVEVRATLTSLKDRTLVGSKVFTSEKAANDNRVEPIIDAYDGAVGGVLDQVVRWTTESLKAPGAA